MQWPINAPYGLAGHAAPTFIGPLIFDQKNWLSGLPLGVQCNVDNEQ